MILQLAMRARGDNIHGRGAPSHICFSRSRPRKALLSLYMYICPLPPPTAATDNAK